MVTRRGKLLHASVYTYLRVCVTRDGQGGSKKGKHKKRLALMTYIKKTSYIGQGIAIQVCLTLSMCFICARLAHNVWT